MLTGVAMVVVTLKKFQEGAWLVVIALPLLVVVSSPSTARTAGSVSGWVWAVSPRHRIASVPW